MRTISVHQLKEKLDNNENFIFLDVREPSEYAAANLNATLLPLGNIANGQIESIEDYRDREVVIHCRSGMRSMQACMLLEQLGFTNTVNVQGGILAWQEVY